MAKVVSCRCNTRLLPIQCWVTLHVRGNPWRSSHAASIGVREVQAEEFTEASSVTPLLLSELPGFDLIAPAPDALPELLGLAFSIEIGVRITPS